MRFADSDVEQEGKVFFQLPFDIVPRFIRRFAEPKGYQIVITSGR